MSFIQGPPLAPHPLSFRPVFHVPEGPLSFRIYDPGSIPTKHASFTLSGLLLRTAGLFSAATMWPDKCTAPNLFQPTRGHRGATVEPEGGLIGHCAGLPPDPGPLVWQALHAFFTYFPTKPPTHKVRLKVMEKMWYILFLFLIFCRIQSPRPQSPPHPPQT